MTRNKTPRPTTLAKKIEQLRWLNPTDAVAIEMIVDYCMERGRAEAFHAGPRGGLKLGPAPTKGGVH